MMGGGSPVLESRRPTVASTPRRLSDLLADLPRAEARGDTGIEIAGLAYRTDEAVPGGLFFCVPGGRFDGHGFAAEAVERGAAALVVERWVDADAVQILVPSSREAMGPLSATFYGRPAERLRLVGVTGTNGKTTTTYLLEEVFRAAGLVPGIVGTTGVRIDGRPVAQPRTTPEAPDLHRLLAEMVEEGVEAVAMEVSSHGLHQHRVGGARFACAVFTNLSQDHLDYHGTMEAYFEAKARLFTPGMSDRAAVNHDSPEGRLLLQTGVPTISYGTAEGADVRAEEVETGMDGVAFRVGEVRIRSSLRGAFNVHNCLAAVAAAHQLGIPAEVVAQGIAGLTRVPGRLEPVEAGQPFQVLVDYAHTPDSVDNALRAARSLAGDARVIAVLGCGGDRDRGKRPLMGEAATRHADLSVITSDNPRSEDPVAIIEEILPGARRGGRAFVTEPDRREAIRLAVREARPGDVVVVAGKGHETGQEFADRTIPFDDRVVAHEELASLLGEGAG
jgi:UDP-N-acetylmuramoyl-L-alanyl-D-glutamate--2,6-diaminopimelate ligase